MTKYVQNEDGGVHSVTDEHFENVLHETSEGGHSYLKYGWKELTAAQARKLAPQLFGAPDTRIVYNANERKEMRDRIAFEKELAAEEAGIAGDDSDDDQGDGDTTPPADGATTPDKK